MRLRNLLVLVGFFAALVALGCWDNQREIERVIEQGYATSAQIIAAQYQRTAPFAIDGWRPRFVEQSLSVDLQWQGKDGKTHIHRKVPVSERFEHAIISGDQVRLITVPVKVLDDDAAVPVLLLDASARLESLRQWLALSGYLVLVGWLGAAGMTLWRRWRLAHPAASVPGQGARGPVRYPFQRLLIGMVAFAVGAFLSYSAAEIGQPGYDAGGSTEVTADITAASGPPYVVQLGWQDGQGGVHHFGPVHVSGDFWNKIERDGKLEVHQTRIRVPADPTKGLPQIIDDAPANRWQIQAVLAGGIVLVLAGIGCLLSAAYTMRRA